MLTKLETTFCLLVTAASFDITRYVYTVSAFNWIPLFKWAVVFQSQVSLESVFTIGTPDDYGNDAAVIVIISSEIK